MKLFLIRHGESVDNVAGLYAGSRDSALTAHGVLQARRLGAHLAARASIIGRVTRIFSSDLQRAFHTAQAIADAQTAHEADTHGTDAQVQVVKVTDLRERDFRSSEGKRFGSRSASGTWENPHPDAETQEEMCLRTDRFVETLLAPILLEEGARPQNRAAIVVVAHGLILNVLLRSLLSRFAPAELARLTGSAMGRSAYLAAWSNTGYLEAKINALAPGPSVVQDEVDQAQRQALRSVSPRDESYPDGTVQLVVTATNVVTHLQGLKKTRGGIGSAQFDRKQTTMDSFLGPSAKRPRLRRDDDA